MVIVSNYSYEQDDYSLLGPQMAATAIEGNTDWECNVLAFGREFDKDAVRRCIDSLTDADRPVVGFGHLAEREDMYDLARELKDGGAVTILGGPQSDVNYLGEVDWNKHENRFRGLSDCFTFALHGPAEQLASFLNSDDLDYRRSSGVIYKEGDDHIINPEAAWDARHLVCVRWDNLYGVGEDGPVPIAVTNVQVLHQLGCPYAAKKTQVALDYPKNINNKPFKKEGTITIDTCGCDFCDVARDKGLGIRLTIDAVLKQIENVPQTDEGRKVPFELINENPFPVLGQLLDVIKQRGMIVSQINLVTRADWLLAGEDKLRRALDKARDMGAVIMMSGVGFESFSDAILRNLNKGYNVETNIAAIRLMRTLKKEYPDDFRYASSDGSIHGFIHPTPWDCADTKREMYRNIQIYRLEDDILPKASVPLIIHHACWLADWARQLEAIEGIKLNRSGSLIEWW